NTGQGFVTRYTVSSFRNTNSNSSTPSDHSPSDEETDSPFPRPRSTTVENLASNLASRLTMSSVTWADIFATLSAMDLNVAHLSVDIPPNTSSTMNGAVLRFYMMGRKNTAFPATPGA